ncbi:MAG: hypothetical protein H2042_17095 [Rhizobiales bacterium]|nr:hypothetical protein [Hyphomicrobiales bacterium]
MLKRAILVLSMICASATAQAAAPQNAGTFNDWSAWTYQEGGRKNCYVYATATSKTPARLDHGDVSFFVRSVRQPANRTEANFSVGYDFAAGSTVKAEIGDTSFEMMVNGGNAWLAAAEQEKELLEAMKGGSDMELTATSRRGNRTSYVFSLDGVTAAVRQLHKDCP